HKARYNFSTKNGSYETNLSLPLSSRFFLTFQYFFGYGDTLLDYNQSTNRYGLGIMLNR
ncbi:MAG: phospholipase, partial [Halobacteriovoraceae bacterium]|nr:phospholipase [Halobacteriovoraceae bacterium]